MIPDPLYAPPRQVDSTRDCFFYHTMDLPGYGRVQGQWDLNPSLDDYLGHVVLKDKRVLELGTADGFLCFQMERRGARVVAFDLSERHAWDLVPFCGEEIEAFEESRKTRLRQLNNAFWLGHRAFQSQAKMVYGSVYNIPEEIGAVDVTTFGSILLHVRDPFLALTNALRLTRETVIITEPVWKQSLLIRLADRFFMDRLKLPFMVFVPDAARREPKETWWILPPRIILRFIAVLGFQETRIIYHNQMLEEGKEAGLIPYYTIVGRRTCKAR